MGPSSNDSINTIEEYELFKQQSSNKILIYRKFINLLKVKLEIYNKKELTFKFMYKDETQEISYYNFITYLSDMLRNWVEWIEWFLTNESDTLEIRSSKFLFIEALRMFNTYLTMGEITYYEFYNDTMEELFNPLPVN